MKKVLHTAGRHISTMLVTALATATGALAPSILAPSKGSTPNKYGVRKRNDTQDARIADHNAQIANSKDSTLSKGKRKKIAAAQRKQANQQANGA